ncbi:zinc finger, AN1-type domain [Coemansia sp. IMI 203386]|nr:zinc finger, AN1-type domain [Coemansia sp. IMI 203386]
MELPDIGDHCEFKDCHLLDFLPVRCKLCGLTFCSDHWEVDKHSCSNKHKLVDRIVPTCPICEQPVPLRPKDSADQAVSRHIESGGCLAKAKSKVPLKPKCAYKGCTDKSMVRTTCKICTLPYCLKHRFESDHECPRRNMSAPPNMNIGAKAIDAMNGVFGRSKSEQKQNPKNPLVGNAARHPRNNMSAGKPISTSNKAKDSGCIIS